MPPRGRPRWINLVVGLGGSNSSWFVFVVSHPCDKKQKRRKDGAPSCLARIDSLRVILSNIGTFGDINPLIAIALELKRRGHVPVMAVPAVFEAKIRPLGIEFHAVRPDIDPENSVLVEMVYDVKHGTEHGLRNFLFPALRQTYDDLLGRGHQAGAGRPAAAGRAELCGAAGGGGNGDPVGELRAGAALVFFRIRSAGAAHVSAAGAGGQDSAWDGPGDQAAGAVCEPEVAAAHLRSARGAGAQARAESAV